MKIGFEAKRAFLNSSGLGNYSRNTLLALYDYYPENQYVLFASEVKSDLFHGYNRFDVIAPENSFSRMFPSFWRSFALSRHLKKHNLDLFHGLSNELPGGIRKAGMPSVVTIHDLIFLRFPEWYNPIDRNIYYRKVKHACDSATKIIAISHQTKDDITEYLDVDQEKIEVIRQSVSREYFETRNTEYLAGKYQIPERFVLSVGTMEPRKNQLAILKAISVGREDFFIVFVGKSGEYTSEMMKFITKNGMENRVKFLSQIPVIDLAGLYQSAMFSVYLSGYEGFGLPVIESMASGCAVITSNRSVLPETAGGAAFLCDPDDHEALCRSMDLLATDENCRNELISKGHEHAKKFHPSLFSEKMISLYSGLIS